MSASERQQTVEEVLVFVRQTYYKPHLKSGNKVKISGGPAEERRQALAAEEVSRIREQSNYLDAAMSGRAHHCGELALLAIHRLHEQHGLEARSLLLGTCGDREQVGEEGEEEQDAVHEVAVIGPASNPLPADMTTWHPDVYVCDPWSNIACRARDYPEKFVAKMEKWERDGKAVGFAPEGFVLPSNEAWIGSVLQGPKMAIKVDLPAAA